MALNNWWQEDYGDGGFKIAKSCGLILAGNHVTFFGPEVSLGIVPDAGALQSLPRP